MKSITDEIKRMTVLGKPMRLHWYYSGSCWYVRQLGLRESDPDPDARIGAGDTRVAALQDMLSTSSTKI
ncbi:hypothetical protein ACYPKM_04755 [Pseudomonas aeruginosa]